VEASGWTAVEFIDHETAKHSDRAAFIKLFDSASRREFDVVLVWALDRFSREGIAQTFAHVDKLASYKVMFESLTEPQFRNTGPTGELMMAIAAWIAKQERIRISDRTKAGLATARRAGRCGGRPAKIFRRDKAEKLRAAGKSWRAIAAELEVDQSTVRRALKKRGLQP
jgi:DNA invertase Pin-like site-specific DNA recombinase